MGRQQNGGNRDNQAIALRQTTEQASRLPIPTGEVAKELSITRPLWKLLTDTVYPSAKTVDGILQAVAYCEARGLDVMKRPVHVVPMWNSAIGAEVETVWPGIGELRTTAARTNQYAGNDDVVFGPTTTKAFADKQTRGPEGKKYVVQDSCDAFDFPLWAQMTVYKMVGGHRVPFVGPKVVFAETFSGSKGLNVPNSMWRKRPFGQLEKCAEAAALRRAFPEEIGEQYVAEEMEGKLLIGHNRGHALDDEEPGGDEAADGPTRAGVREKTEALANDENFVESTMVGLDGCKKLAHVDRAWNIDRERIENLDQDLRDKVEAAYKAARDRLRPAKTQEAADSDDDPLTDAEIDEYRTQFRADLAAREIAVDVGALLTRERDNLAALPDVAREELEREAEKRKAELTGGQGSDDGGEAAPSDDDSQQPPQE